MTILLTSSILFEAFKAMLYGLITLLIAMVIHELAHYFTYNMYTQEKPRYYIARKKQIEFIIEADKLDDGQFENFLIAGVISGAVFILIMMISSVGYFYMMIMVMIIYVTYCKHDIKEIIRLEKTK